MGLQPFEVRFFFEEKVTKCDLALHQFIDRDDDEEEDPKNCFKIAQNRVCCTLGYIYKHIGTRKFLTKALSVYSHLKSEFLFLQKVT